MISIGDIFPFVFPGLVVCLAVILLCLYLHVKKKKAAYDVTLSTLEHNNTSLELYTISLSDGQAEEDRHDTQPPQYSTVDHPPPYSLFDPKLTSVLPGGPAPAYEMYPLTLPLGRHHWMTPTVPTSPSSTSTRNQPQPQRLHAASTS